MLVRKTIPGTQYSNCALPCLIRAVSAILIAIGPATLAAPPATPVVKINYRELIDVSVYGHSGQPAGDVLEQLSLTTPEGLARVAFRSLLEERLEDLFGDDSDPGTAPNGEESDGALSERDQILSILDNETLFDAMAEQYRKDNQELIEATATENAAEMGQLIEDVEPVCEPAAVVLNDALAHADPSTVNPNLVELAAFYPGGRVEPGWADLVRTRRFVVYTNGNSYCRLFLPGEAAEPAWDAAYPVMRHILKSLLDPHKSGHALTVDVYAYENDIPSTTFTLHLAKFTNRVTEQELGTPQGLKSLDLVKWSHFFQDGLSLEGCGLDENGDLVLIGSKQTATPTLEGHPIALSDLAVAYRASAYAGHGESYMSLDASESPQHVNVNFGGRLHDTRMGWVAYRCDMRFKTLGDDVDAVTYEDQRPSILRALPDYLSQQRRFFAYPDFRNISSESTRFWFYPDDFKIVTSPTGTSCLVTRPRFTAAAERQEGRDAEGKDLNAATPAWTRETLEHFNANYRIFGQLYPEVEELDHAARLLAVAEWMYQARQSGRIMFDFDELLAVPLPAVPTPRQREHLVLRYAVKNESVPAEFQSYCMLDPAERTAFQASYDRDYRRPGSPWEIYAVTTGGLDYSARKAVKSARDAVGPEADIIRIARTSKRAFDTVDGRTIKSSGALPGGPPRKPPRRPVTVETLDSWASGEGLRVTGRKYEMPEAGGVAGLSVEGDALVWFSKYRTNAFNKDGALHSIWVNEHRKPQKFAIKTTEGNVTYRFVANGESMKAKRLLEQREPTDSELGFLTAALSRNGVATSEVWSMIPSDLSIRALDVSPKGEVLVHYRSGDGLVLRVVSPDGTSTVLSGEQAIRRLNDVSAEKVRAFSEPGKVELLHVRFEDERVVLTVGKRKPIEIDAREWGKWLLDGGDAAPPDAVAALYRQLADANGGQGVELVVMRDAAKSRPQRFADAGDGFVDFLRLMQEVSLEERLAPLRMSKKELTAELEFLSGALKETDPAMQETIQSKIDLLEEIRQLSDADRRAQIVELEGERNSLASQRVTGDVVELAAKLKLKLPRLRVSQDDPSALVPKRVQKEVLVSKASDVGLAVPPGEARVDDKGILKRILAVYRQSKITSVATPEDLAKVGNVLVITAHNDQAFFDYIQTLGEHKINGKSALDGKTLMLLTCFEPGNPNLVSEVLRRYNCAGVHIQSAQVHKHAVQRALIEFATRLDQLGGGKPQRLRDIYDSTIRSLLESNEPGVRSMRAEFEKMLRATVQWCMSTEAEMALQEETVA